MKNLYVLCFLLSFLCSMSLFGQNSWRTGVEVGASFSQFSFEETKANVLLSGNKYSTSKGQDKPTFGPLIGVMARFEKGNHWFFDGALQYQVTGRNLIENAFIAENNTGANPIATDDFTEKQTFQKVALPVSVGYHFGSGRRILGLSLGIRVNYLLSGKIMLDNTNTVRSVSTKISATADPFDIQAFSTLPVRNVNQIFASLFLRLGKHLDMSARMNFSPKNIEYVAKTASPLCVSGDCLKEMRGDDFQFVVRYYLQQW